MIVFFCLGLFFRSSSKRGRCVSCLWINGILRIGRWPRNEKMPTFGACRKRTLRVFRAWFVRLARARIWSTKHRVKSNLVGVLPGVSLTDMKTMVDADVVCGRLVLRLFFNNPTLFQYSLVFVVSHVVVTVTIRLFFR